MCKTPPVDQASLHLVGMPIICKHILVNSSLIINTSLCTKTQQTI